MVRLFWFAQTEIFQNKWNVLKGSPKFPNGISERKMCLPFAIRYQFQAIGSISQHDFIAKTKSSVGKVMTKLERSISGDLLL